MPKKVAAVAKPRRRRTTRWTITFPDDAAKRIEELAQARDTPVAVWLREAAMDRLNRDTRP
jgi:hypothetical protein